MRKQDIYSVITLVFTMPLLIGLVTTSFLIGVLHGIIVKSAPEGFKIGSELFKEVFDVLY